MHINHFLATSATLSALLFTTIVTAATSTPTQPAAAPSNVSVARGEYLVTTNVCNDCHTPWVMGPQGPAPDMTRALSGHPEGFAVAAAPKLPEPWVWAATGSNTAFAGPWGISFTANLTPDKETGLGAWTADQFVRAIRTGKHLGKGRPILPPMPWPMYSKMTDDDLRSIFAYLQTIPAIRNKVPNPVEPAEGGR